MLLASENRSFAESLSLRLLSQRRFEGPHYSPKRVTVNRSARTGVPGVMPAFK